MSTLPRRQYGILITLVLAVVAAAVGGFVLFASGKAGGVDLTTAKYVPADAGAYVAINTNLSSNQWVSTFKLLERLGVDDPEGQLKDTAEQGDLDWEDDVAPFLGGNAGFFVRSFSLDTLDFEGGIIVKCADAERALKVFRKQSGMDFSKDKHNGTEYLVADGETVFVANVDGHLLLATNEGSLFAMLDTGSGKEPSLQSQADFKRLRDELTTNFIAFVYFDAEDLTSGLFFDDEVTRKAIKDAGAGDLIFKPGALVLGAKPGGFEFQAASVGKSGVLTPLLEPHESRFAKIVPADAAIFFSMHDFAGAWNEALKQARKDIDEAIRTSSDYDSLDDALKDAGRQLGLRSIEQIIDQLTGETAIAAWFPEKTQESVQVVLLAEVRDQAKAEEILTKAVESSNARRRTEDVKGTKLSVFRDESGDDVAYGFKDGYLVLGSAEQVRAVFEGKLPPLAESKRYRRTVDQMPTKLGTYAFFDLSTLLALTEGGIPVDLDEAERALEGAILNVVNERGVARFSGVVSIKE